MLSKETEKALKNFASNVKKQAVQNVGAFSTSGKLEKSIDYDLEIHKNSFSLEFEMLDYGDFQDQGVSGLLKKYKTPFTYKDKSPPLKKLDKWIVKKGIAPKDKKGKFISRESLKFLISRKIFFYGLKPKQFFSQPFNTEFKKLPNKIIESFALDVETFLKTTTKK